MVIDFHSHILPGIDDGSRDVQTSIEMLTISKAQGVDFIVATPHFYAMRNTVERFLRMRELVYGTLTDTLAEQDISVPGIALGAEVAFFQGISRADEIAELTIQGTKLLLLEMPFRPWTQSDVDEVEALVRRRGLTVILAHLERYFPIWENKQYIKQLLQLPLYVQINAESLLDWRQRRKLIRLIRQEQIHLLGSDCHSLHRRPPNLAEGRAVIAKRLGQQSLYRIDEVGENLLSKGALYV